MDITVANFKPMEICDIVIGGQKNAWFCNIEPSMHYIVKVKLVDSKSLYYIAKLQKMHDIVISP